MFERLFSPIQIGQVTAKNRIQLPPHSLHYFENGMPTGTLLEYYLERARGGAGLLEVSQIYVKPPTGVFYPEWEYDNKRTWPMLNTPEIVPGLEKLAGGVHEFEAKIIMEVSAWTFLYGPVSSVPFETGVSLRELTLADIHEIQEGFAKASKYVAAANFDGVDLHGSHGALIEHFYSPIMNRRDDRYGGNFENRLRFLSELIDIVRGTIGDSKALGMRLCADEQIEGGVTPEYAAKIASTLDGGLDFINVDRGSMYNYDVLDQNALQTEPLYSPTGYGTYMSAPIKAVVTKTKIGLAGRIMDPLMGDSIIESNQADYVGMTRALIADPYLPKKAREGRLQEIRPCIGTLEGCWARSAAHDFPMRCSVNAAVGRESRRGREKFTPAQKKKKVLVVGAGPAGLEAARVSALRGHDVVVYEKDSRPGGQVNIGKLFPGRSDIASIITWLEAEIRRLGVRVEYNKEVPDSIEVARFLCEEEKPDVLVLATGSRPVRSGIQMISFKEIPGWNGGNVHSVDDLLSERIRVEGKKFLVADSTTYLFGPGACEWLLRKGASEITYLTPQTEVSHELNDYNQLVHFLKFMRESRVRVLTSSWIRRIDSNHARVYHVPTGAESAIEADEVILHTGREQNNSLHQLFKGLISEIYQVGDCRVAGGKIRDAIEDGFESGMRI